MMNDSDPIVCVGELIDGDHSSGSDRSVKSIERSQPSILPLKSVEDPQPSIQPLKSVEDPETSVQPSSLHWRERLKQLPNPWGFTDTDSDSDDEATWFTKPRTPHPVAFIRRSQRIEEKNPLQFIRFPPYYGDEPSKKTPKRKIKPMVFPDYKKSLREWEAKQKLLPPPPYFSPAEKEEMRRDLPTYTVPKNNGGLDQEGPSPGSTVIPSDSSPVDPTQYPLMSRVNESTLPAIGMMIKREDGKMRACFPDL